MKAEDIRAVAVIGAGLMGHGIAQEFALAGYATCLRDLTQEKLEQAKKSIRANLERLLGVGLISPEQVGPVLERIRFTTSLEEAVREADLVIECVFENLEVKREVFRALDEICPERTILASNSSSLMPSKLASATRRADRVLVAHYFNPPYLVPLVEVVQGEATSDETVATVRDLLLKMGKSPAVVRREAPGFIANRLQLAIWREAIAIVERGIASPEDVDIAVRGGLGRRWAVAGPFEIGDLAGWDLAPAMWLYLVPDLESSAEMPALVKQMVERGELGVKTGKGAYEWTPESAEALRRRIAQALVRIAQWDE